MFIGDPPGRMTYPTFVGAYVTITCRLSICFSMRVVFIAATIASSAVLDAVNVLFAQATVVLDPVVAHVEPGITQFPDDAPVLTLMHD